MRITVLAGGIGAARFLRGLKAAAPDAQITVVGNTGDDITLFGLRVCPDLDTVMYTLGGGINPEQGWGRADESFAIRDELAAYGAGPSWFTLGDRDFATHILRTQLLGTGKPLSEVTRLLCERWQPGVRLLPMSDDRIETHVTLADDPGLGAGASGHCPVDAGYPLPGVVGPPARSGPRRGDLAGGRGGGSPRARRPRRDPRGGLRALPAVQPGGQHRADPGRTRHPGCHRGRRPSSAVSGIIGGAPVRGMADACLATIGVEIVAPQAWPGTAWRRGC